MGLELDISLKYNVMSSAKAPFNAALLPLADLFFACNRRFSFFHILFPNGVQESVWERRDAIREKRGDDSGLGYIVKAWAFALGNLSSPLSPPKHKTHRTWNDFKSQLLQLPHFIVEDSESQRGGVIFLGSQYSLVADIGLEIKSSDMHL